MTMSRSPVVESTMQGYVYVVATLPASAALSVLSWLSLKYPSDLFSNLYNIKHLVTCSFFSSVCLFFFCCVHRNVFVLPAILPVTASLTALLGKTDLVKLRCPVHHGGV